MITPGVSGTAGGYPPKIPLDAGCGAPPPALHQGRCPPRQHRRRRHGDRGNPAHHQRQDRRRNCSGPDRTTSRTSPRFGTSLVDAQVSKAPDLILVETADQAAGENTRAGPAGSLLSRTPTMPGRLVATSTQLPPLLPLRLDFRHRARDRSLIVTRASSLSLAFQV